MTRPLWNISIYHSSVYNLVGYNYLLYCAVQSLQSVSSLKLIDYLNEIGTINQAKTIWVNENNGNMNL
jgi:hypothetical protein